MHLAEVELRKVTRRTRCRTRAAAYARLQLGHFADNLVTFAEIVAVNVDGTRLIYGKAEVYHFYEFLSFLQPLYNALRCRRALVYRLTDTLWGSHSTGIEHTVHTTLYIVQEHIFGHHKATWLHG